MAVANQAACHFEAWHMKPEGFSFLSPFSWPMEGGLGLLRATSLSWHDMHLEAQQQENTKYTTVSNRVLGNALKKTQIELGCDSSMKACRVGKKMIRWCTVFKCRKFLFLLEYNCLWAKYWLSQTLFHEYQQKCTSGQDPFYNLLSFTKAKIVLFA